MRNGRQPAAPGRANRGEKLVDWFDGRLGVHKSVKAGLRRVFPDHWSLMLGEISLYSFVILLLTGAYLMLFFHPSMNMVEYHGSYAPLRGQMVSEAFDSTMHISFDVRGGLLIRQVHHWAALVFVASILVHMMRVFFTGAFRRPREINWLVGFALLVLAMFAGLTGYDMPDDLLSGTGLAVVNGTLLSVPIVGTYVSMFLFGGAFPGNDLVARFTMVHVLLIPALMVGLMALHVVLVIRQGQSQYPGPGRTEKNVVGLPLRVRAVKSGGYFFLTCGVLFFLGALAQINPIWDYGPYRPDQVSAGSQPDWYMAVADGLLRVMPGWEITLWGHTLALDNLIPLGFGVALFLAMAAYPFIEAWVTDDRREHHILERARNRPVRTGLGVAWLSEYLVAVVGAGNDIIATHFHVSVNGVTWAVRIGLFVVPPVVFVLTKRIALGLQLQDRDLVLHGRETGVIKRLPHGEFVELHEPLSQERRHLLTAHEQYEPIGPGPSAQDNGAVNGLRNGAVNGARNGAVNGARNGAPESAVNGAGRARRMQAVLSRGLYGKGTQVTKATAEEYKRIAPEHRR